LAEQTLDDRSVWRLDTFRVAPGSLDGRATVIVGDEGHHAVDVVRVSRGDVVRLIDGEGAEALARVEAAGRAKASLSIIDVRVHAREEGTELVLCQGLVKGRGFDGVVRRCAELGVSRIVPVVTERVIARPGAGSRETRLRRWRGIALAAAKQSRGVFVTRVDDVRRLDELASLCGESDLSVVAWEEETAVGLSEALRSAPGARVIVAVVGPEGGLSAGEVAALRGMGAQSVGIGPRVLRADSAGAAIAAAISHESGGLLP
jgi:16S rRNA (uracil1498-N3)-methyltransferase